MVKLGRQLISDIFMYRFHMHKVLACFDYFGKLAGESKLLMLDYEINIFRSSAGLAVARPSIQISIFLGVQVDYLYTVILGTHVGFFELAPRPDFHFC